LRWRRRNIERGPKRSLPYDLRVVADPDDDAGRTFDLKRRNDFRLANTPQAYCGGHIEEQSTGETRRSNARTRGPIPPLNAFHRTARL
jgi:hypothetical protein